MYAWQTMELSRHAAMQIFSAWSLRHHETPWRRERSGADAFRCLPRELGGQLGSKHCVDTSGRWIWWGTGDHWWVEDSYQSIEPTLVLVLSGVSFCQYPSCNTIYRCFRTHTHRPFLQDELDWVLGFSELWLYALRSARLALEPTMDASAW